MDVLFAIKGVGKNMNTGYRIIFRLFYLVVIFMPNVLYILSFYNYDKTFCLIDIVIVIIDLIGVYNLFAIIKDIKKFFVKN